MTLSKSNYINFLKHPAWLWLSFHQKHRLPEIDENLQALFDQGHEFEIYAEKLYPQATKLGFDNYSEYVNLPEKTKQALKTSESILQGRFETDGLTCIVDILDKVDDELYDLIEIKSSTKAKPSHNHDLAFQTIVLEKSGLNLRNISLLHVNSEYVRDGSIDPDKIAAQVDLTDSVRKLLPTTQEQINQAKQILKLPEMPDPSPRHTNKLEITGTKWMSDWLEIYRHLNPDLDPYSIYFLTYPKADQIADLEDAGIKHIKDIPKEMALREKQKLQIITTRENAPMIKKDKIKQFLAQLKYPLYFLDYETMSSVIPMFDGFRPWKDYPFQYSLHKLTSTEGQLTHQEYLHQEATNPMPGLLEKLNQDIGGSGTILTWNMKYEKGCNKRMGEMHPEHKDFLDALNERIEDLMTPFSKMWYVDKDFYGSASLKKVLPVLVPELKYEELEVSDGLKARRIWMQTVLEGKNQSERKKITDDLSEYCTQDTLAMVRILEELHKLTE